MSETGTGLRLLAFGLTIGALADLTLRELPWGLNAAVVVTALVAVIMWQQAEHGPCGVGYGVAAIAAAAGLAWRDSTVLKLLDLVCIVVLLGLLASARRGQAAPPSLTGYLLRISGTAAHGAFGTPLLVAQDVDWTEVRLGVLLRVLLAVGRGLAIAFPVLLVFTALLVSADPLFGRLVDSVFDVDVVLVIGHVAGVAIAGYFATGLLRAAVVRSRPAHAFPERPRWLALGHIELSLLLALVDALFAVFVWIQVRYLFGGEEWLHQVPGLTYSAYARRGFFELCAVTALVLPMLLVAHWLHRAQTRTQARSFAILAGTQALLVLVMLVSAFERMRLYREEYGLTELRFYTTAFMLWLGVLLMVFMATVLHGRRDSFAEAALATAGIAVLLLHVVDPDAWIVRTNATLPRDFDVPYALALSSDAVPSLLEHLPSLGPSQRCALAVGLNARWRDPDPDWRTWSLARTRAQALVESAEAAFRPEERCQQP
jgi:Domain of unknown function (DUF4173)